MSKIAIKKFLIGAWLLAVTATVFITCASAQTATPPRQLIVDDMAATMRVTPMPTGGSLQRIVLPADLMMHSQSPTLADLRLFNLKGEAIPFALRGTATESTAVTTNKVTLNALTIRKNGDSITAGNTIVQIKNGSAEIKVLVETPGASAVSTSATAIAAIGIDAGKLVDTRKVEGVLTAIDFDIDLPANQVVPITVEASRDFVNWEILANAKSVYRFGDASLANANSANTNAANTTLPQLTSIELPTGAEIKDRYLRITWPAQNNSAVVIRNVTLTMESSKRVPIAQPKRPLGVPSATTSHTQEWQLESPLRLRTLLLTTDQTGTLLPITILGRDNDKQPWRQIGSTVVFKLEMAGAEVGQNAGKSVVSSNAAVLLNGTSIRQLKIEAPASSAGIAAGLITAAIEYEAQEIIAAIKPSEDITVAVGAKNAASVALPLQTIVPDISAQRLLQLGMVSASEAVKFYPERLLAADAKAPTDSKSMILWGALLLGIGVLGAMAWGTMRQLKAGKK